MKEIHIDLILLQQNATTKTGPIELASEKSLWVSSFNPTLGQDIYTKPLRENYWLHKENKRQQWNKKKK